MGRVPTFSVKWKKAEKAIIKFYKASIQGIEGTGVKSGCLELEVNLRIAERRLLQGGFDLVALTPVQGVHMAKRHNSFRRSHSHRKTELRGIKWSYFHSPCLKKRPLAPAGLHREVCDQHRSQLQCQGRDLCLEGPCSDTVSEAGPVNVQWMSHFTPHVLMWIDCTVILLGLCSETKLYAMSRVRSSSF